MSEPARKDRREVPAAKVKIYKQAPGDIIVNAKIGKVIIIRIVVADRPPFGLLADVNAKAYLRLCLVTQCT
jgi:hypothetical protein